MILVLLDLLIIDNFPSLEVSWNSFLHELDGPARRDSRLTCVKLNSTCMSFANDFP